MPHTVFVLRSLPGNLPGRNPETTLLLLPPSLLRFGALRGTFVWQAFGPNEKGARGRLFHSLMSPAQFGWVSAKLGRCISLS
jgi:hypothetical protein